MFCKQGKAVVVESPVTTLIYATNCVPMVVDILFPRDFTENDRKRAYEALRLIYDEVTDRENK